MKRREFITLIGGMAVAWPLAARAQPGGGMPRVIVVVVGGDQKERDTAFRQGLERRGWVDGRNVLIDTRFAPADSTDPDALAKQLAALQPDVIVVQTTPYTAAMQRQPSAIPVVFVSVSDPLGSGFITSLARPGSNLTGLMLYEGSVTGKWLAMLKEIAPSLQRAALVHNPKTTTFYLRAAAEFAPSLAIELVPSPVETAADIERAIESFARAPNGGLLVTPDFATTVHRDLIISLAARYRLPAVYSDRPWTIAGGLMSYSTDLVDQFRQAAAYVDSILRGSKPAELPVQAPTKYQTVLNLRTAKMLGLTVPPGLLVAADEVIE